MGEIIACLSCCCLIEKLKPIYIEIIELIFSIIEIASLEQGLHNVSYIPWNNIRKGAKIFYIIMFILICINFIIIIVLICLRCCKKINTTKNDLGIYLCITNIVLFILSKILSFIIEVIIAHDMYYNDVHDNSVFIPLISNELGLAFHCYFSCFLFKLIYAKTDLNYSEYQNQKKLNNGSTSVNIIQNGNDYLRKNQSDYNLINRNNQNFQGIQSSLNNTSINNIQINNNDNSLI